MFHRFVSFPFHFRFISVSSRAHLGKFGRVLGDFADERGGVLADEVVGEAEAGEDLGEDLSLDDDLGEVERVLRDLRERGANLPLQLRVLRDNERGEEGHRPGVHDRLRELRRVLRDVRQRRRRNALQRELRLLHAQNQEWNRPRVHDLLRELRRVARHVAERLRGTEGPRESGGGERWRARIGRGERSDRSSRGDVGFMT